MILGGLVTWRTMEPSAYLSSAEPALSDVMHSDNTTLQQLTLYCPGLFQLSEGMWGWVFENLWLMYFVSMSKWLYMGSLNEFVSVWEWVCVCVCKCFWAEVNMCVWCGIFLSVIRCLRSSFYIFLSKSQGSFYSPTIHCCRVWYHTSASTLSHNRSRSDAIESVCVCGACKCQEATSVVSW